LISVNKLSYHADPLTLQEQIQKPMSSSIPTIYHIHLQLLTSSVVRRAVSGPKAKAPSACNEYTALTHDWPLAAAEAMAELPEKGEKFKFVYISGEGADPTE
jgi:hypothetical protein